MSENKVETWGQALKRWSRPTKYGLPIPYMDFWTSIAGLMVYVSKVRLEDDSPTLTMGDEVIQRESPGISNPDHIQIERVLFGQDFFRSVAVKLSFYTFLEWLFKQPLPEEWSESDMAELVITRWNEHAKLKREQEDDGLEELKEKAIKTIRENKKRK